MKSLIYFLLVCIFALFVLPKKQQPKQEIKVKHAVISQQLNIDSFKRQEQKKIDSTIDKIEKNNAYLYRKQKSKKIDNE